MPSGLAPVRLPITEVAVLFLLSLACTKDGILGDDTAADKELLGILIAPESLIVPIGSTAQLRATGLYADRTSGDITQFVEWSASGGTVSVSNSLDAEGTVEGLSVGDTQIVASWQGIDSVPLNASVTSAELLGLTIEPKELDLALGDEVQLAAIAAYSDGNRADSSSQVRWLTDSGSIAQIAAGGVLLAAGEGSTNIRAEWEGMSTPDAPVTVVKSAQADLVVSEMSAVASSSTITVTVTIENKGQKGASEFWVDVFLDPSGTPSIGQLGDDFDLLSYVGPGKTIQANFVLSASAGQHTVAVLADSNDDVKESNESNNTFSGQVDAGALGPNLSISYFDYVADEYSIYYAVDVYNSGTETVDEFYIDLFVDPWEEPTVGDVGDGFVLVESLEPGETTYADFLVEYDGCYPCWSHLYVDSDQYIDETDETDNYAGPLYVYNE